MYFFKVEFCLGVGMLDNTTILFLVFFEETAYSFP